MIFWLTAGLLTAATLLGGGTQAGFFGDVLVQLLAIPLLLLCLWSWRQESLGVAMGRWRSQLPLRAAALVFFASLVVQLLPLPSLLWVGWHAGRVLPSPGSEAIAAGTWRELSLTPAASWAALASALPPLALFLGVARVDSRCRIRFTALVIVLGALALIVGFLQVAQGPQSSLRFFAFTNPTEAVGFFANRNHFAAQLYTLLVFAAVWFALTAKDTLKLGVLDQRAMVWLAIAGALLTATLVGLALARSRAGIVLALAALAGVIAIVLSDRRHASNIEADRRRSAHGLALMALGLAVLFAAEFGTQRIITRLDTDPLADLRFALTSTTLNTALFNLPFGTGLGSFVPVYASQEKTADLFAGFANRAHNDWAEFLLETGVFGLALAALFLRWFAIRSRVLWASRPNSGNDHHLALQRAASIVIALLLAHSLVDYPLRTTAIAVLFAFVCALLTEPPEAIAPPSLQGLRSLKRRPRASTSWSMPSERWGEDVVWPDAWKQSE